ncbi:class I SAM-dependent methyltransferase [Kitasatospora sp. NPDC059599]|uniref:class I SAM-dependent methyltransferase n=1 Tax=Kitasatospora sp. NPDC059599 TaxID=3346880 RepID=UPI0036CE0C3C
MTPELTEQHRTRPGTPMIGVYSTNQMDDFYGALANGEAKPSGLMNLMQHLIAAERCPEGANVLDVCCGRGLALPLLHRYAPNIARYVGLDISPDNLDEARTRLETLRRHYGTAFPIDFLQCDVSESWPELPPFDVAIYTSALEHLPYELGVKSLAATGAALAGGGVLYLSTPQAFGPPPRPLQYRVHVYEWSREEVERAVADAGLVVEDVMGLLPPSADEVAAELEERFGSGAVDWYRHLAARVPTALLDTVSSVSVANRATELLFVCRRPA